MMLETSGHFQISASKKLFSTCFNCPPTQQLVSLQYEIGSQKIIFAKYTCLNCYELSHINPSDSQLFVEIRPCPVSYDSAASWQTMSEPVLESYKVVQGSRGGDSVYERGGDARRLA